MQTPFAWVELFSMSCALLGSLLLALKGKRAGFGWVLFAFSNAGWIVFAQGYGHWFLLVQQVGFSITSAIGIWTYLLRPRTSAILLWRIAAGPNNAGVWRLTQTARVAAIWVEQGLKVQSMDATGVWE